MKKQPEEAKAKHAIVEFQEKGFKTNFPLVNQILTKIQIWRQISAQRSQLNELSDNILKDIGLSRIDAEREASRYFLDSGSKSDVTLRKRGEAEQNENCLIRLECSDCQC